MHIQVKTPEESTGPGDVYNVLASVPAEEAFRPMSEGNCPLVAARLREEIGNG